MRHTSKITAGFGFAVAASIAVSAAAQSAGDPITKTDMTTPGYTFPADLPADASHTELANYAWRLFIAATQRTDATLADGWGRTTSSQNSDFITTGQSPAFGNPLVFEGFYHRSEAYPYYATPGDKPAAPINSVPYYSFYYEDSSAQKVAFPVAGQNYVNLDETNEIGLNFLFFNDATDPDFEVLYMAKVSEEEVNYAWDREPPTASASWNFPPLIEVKSAWRRVSDLQGLDPTTFHQAAGTYYIGEEGSGEAPQVVTDMFALVGLHIIQKTPNYPAFIFTTFEHKDAVSRDSNGTITDPAFELTYDEMYYDTAQTAGVTPTATVTGAYDVNLPGQPAAANATRIYTLPTSGPQDTSRTTVVQPYTITAEVNDVNNQVYDLITSIDSSNIWANYRLKGVQGQPTSDDSDLDFYLANIDVESSQPLLQLFRGTLGKGRDSNGNKTSAIRINGRSDNNISTGLVEGQPVPTATINMGGCQGCHGNAQQAGSDFSFLPASAGGNGFSPDPVATEALSAEELASHIAAMAAKK